MSKCTICGEKITLIPSAEERSKSTGRPAAFYTSLFSEHAGCTIEKRSREASENMARAVASLQRGEPVHII